MASASRASAPSTGGSNAWSEASTTSAVRDNAVGRSISTILIASAFRCSSRPESILSSSEHMGTPSPPGAGRITRLCGSAARPHYCITATSSGTPPTGIAGAGVPCHMPGIGESSPMIRVILAQPRGFCAGVERAIEIVERALKKYGPPIYVRHEIVHNRHVVEDLRTRGAVFVDELDEIPPGSMTVFSAHGVAKRIEAAAAERGLPVIDAT